MAKGEEMMKDSHVNPPPQFGTITQNLIFNDGVTKLLKVIFMSEEDATTSIKVAIQRAFPQISATIKNRYKSKDGTKIISIGYDCTKSVHKKSDKERSSECEKHEGCEKCHWKAILVPMDDGNYIFTKIGTLENHLSKCFDGYSNIGQTLLDSLAKKIGDRKKDITYFNAFNDTFLKKTNYTIPKYRVNRHINYKETQATQVVYDRYRDIYAQSENCLSNLSCEDMELIGAFMEIKKGNAEFEYETVVSQGSKIMGVMCLWPNQKEVLREFFDLVFIDSTYNVNNRKFNALNVVVVDGHYRTVLAATAIVRSELTDSYSKLLSFIWEKVKPRRMPLCMISDSAFQIHSAMSKTFPYCRHIYCAFHLLREESLFGKDSSLGSEEKEMIKSHVKTMLTSNSLNQVESEAYNLYIYEEGLSQNESTLKKKILKLVGHALNGSKPLQDVFTASSIASSRVECMNSVLKGFGMDTSKTLLEDIFLLKEIALYQSHLSHHIDRKKWKYVHDESFKKCLCEGVISSITSEVLEMMHDQFLMAHGGKYNVSLVGGVYNVTYKCGNPFKAYYAHVVTPYERGFFCQCIISSGYACRHIFAVVEHLNLTQKVTLKTVNSRFYLNQDIVNIREVNTEAMKMIESTISMKNDRYGSIFTEIPPESFSKRSNDSEVNKSEIFERDLAYSQAIGSGATEQVRKVLSHPRLSSSPPPPPPNEEEKDIDIVSPGTCNALGECEIPEEKTVYAVPILPPKIPRLSLEEIPLNVDEIVDEEMAHLSKLDLDELRVIAIQRYRSAIEKASKSYVIESIRESIRAEVTSDLKEGPKKKDHKREDKMVIVDADDI